MHLRGRFFVTHKEDFRIAEDAYWALKDLFIRMKAKGIQVEMPSWIEVNGNRFYFIINEENDR
jgi:hypothetical protein